MQKVIHRSESRGLTSTGWLVSRHSFSFGNYYNKERMGFGMLRVLNQDLILPGEGFSTHHHENMEIISIPLQGSLKHQDSTGSEMVIQDSDVQIMSAGTGVEHSEFNNSEEDPAYFLQIWIYPQKKNISPRYDQKKFHYLPGDLTLIVAPTQDPRTLWINQDAWLYLGQLNKGQAINYDLKKKGNGIYIFVIEGEIKVADETLKTGDGIGISSFSSVTIDVLAHSKLLLMEVPLQ